METDEAPRNRKVLKVNRTKVVGATTAKKSSKQKKATQAASLKKKRTREESAPKRTFEEAEFPDSEPEDASKAKSGKRRRIDPAASSELKGFGIAPPSADSPLFTIGQASLGKKRKDVRQTPARAPFPKASPLVVGFHKPGDEGYSMVAIRNPDEEERKEPQDWREWASKCRCLRCEAIRAASILRGCKVVILLDIDNWGFEFMARKEKCVRLPPDVFFWCFYGAGIEHVAGLALEQINFSELATQSQIKTTIFSEAESNKRLQFSPAGGHKQAADLAILETVSLLRNMHVIVITGDRELRQQAEVQTRTIPPDGIPRRVATINPVGRQGTEVWGQVMRLHQQFTASA
eukprot:NODE_3799_length_1161_cov_51.097303_g3613_i0.p1 GENE.NODE_3799_length_1161_cov_51.097303_g3613_i0~~NODE_3799_length_1161_cov_51.097303_g3613_i0.p1  ORF type:complete len:367 (+),score=50.98 NODE_3799_length_1161_cov_51.097303_g3613_i0:60-1103(+)